MLNINKSLKAIILLCFITLTACANNHSTESNILVGVVTKEHLLVSEEIFNDNYRDFSLEVTDEVALNNWPKNLHIDIYFGTWCHDSQREVPKILSILENNKQTTSQLIALDVNKNDTGGLAKAANIKFTPTFVIFAEGKEIGRIIERPNDSLVKDITRFYMNSLKVID